MATTYHRVLMVLVLIAAVLPWLGGPDAVWAQAAEAKEEKTETTAGDESAPAGAPTAGGLSVPTGGLIAIIEIDGAILNEFQLESLKRRVDRAVQDGADLIVFDLNTPGGRLDIAIAIVKLIRGLPVPSVAWVNDRALSAGVFIGSACDELIMSRQALTGDCGPITPGRDMANTERAKALSELLAEFKLNAQDNYSGQTTSDYALFHAMCVLGIDVYQVRHKITGETRLVSQADYEIMVDGVSPIDAADIGPGNAGGALVDPESGEDLGRPTVTVTQTDMGQWELVSQVHNGSTLLTINTKESLAIGLSRATISNEVELKQLYGAGTVQHYEETWSESLVGFLVHPLVRACLLLLAIAGFLLEYFSPGMFVPGIVGLIAFAILVGAPFLVGLAQTWHLILIVMGAALIVYELITMTTFGVLAVVGLLMFLAGLVLSGVQTASNGLPASGSEVIITSVSFVGAIVLTVPLMIVFTRYFGSLPFLNRLILNESLPASIPAEGTTAMPHQRVAGDESVGAGTIKPGMTGTVTATGLRPAGRIEIEDQLIDVTSTGGFIEPGTAVRVVEVHGNMISVEAV